MGHSDPAAKRAAMLGGKKETISDEEYVKRLRNDVASKLYPAIEGTHALLREYDKVLVQLSEAQTALTNAQKRVLFLETKESEFAATPSEVLQEQLEPLPGEVPVSN